MLIQSHSIYGGVIGRKYSNVTVTGYVTQAIPEQANKNRYIGGINKISGTPEGYLHPVSLVMPQIGGGMSSYEQLNASMSTTDAKLNLGINISAVLDAAISLSNAQLDQIVNLLASLSADINITNAALSAAAELQASITASVSITQAQLGAIIDMMASLNALGQFTNVGIFATASLSADMSVSTGTATPQQIAAEVWDTILADHQAAGSTGKALNDAGSAGNPWSALKSANNDPGTFGEELQNIKPNTDLIPAAL